MTYQQIHENIACFYQVYCADDLEALITRTYDGDPT